MKRDTFLYVCRTITTFTEDGEVDTAALHPFLERLIEPRIGMYVASSGSGIGQALNHESLSKIYRVAVAVGRGKVEVGANIPEQYIPSLSIEHARLAAAAGVDIINIYGPDGRHSFRPSGQEYRAYFDHILREISHPISLCPNPTLGYTPKPEVIASIANDYPQIKNVILTGIRGDDLYFINLMDALKRDVDVFVTEGGSLNTLTMGAAGMAGNLANFIPKTYRKYLDLISAGRIDETGPIYTDIRRLMQFTGQWTGGAPRWHLMFLKALKLPGWQGRLPEPFIGFPESEEERFKAGLLALGIREVNEAAKGAM